MQTRMDGCGDPLFPSLNCNALKHALTLVVVERMQTILPTWAKNLSLSGCLKAFLSGCLSVWLSHNILRQTIQVSLAFSFSLEVYVWANPSRRFHKYYDIYDACFNRNCWSTWGPVSCKPWQPTLHPSTPPMLLQAARPTRCTGFHFLTSAFTLAACNFNVKLLFYFFPYNQTWDLSQERLFNNNILLYLKKVSVWLSVRLSVF